VKYQLAVIYGSLMQQVTVYIQIYFGGFLADKTRQHLRLTELLRMTDFWKAKIQRQIWLVELTERSACCVYDF